MQTIAVALVVSPLVVALYAYVGYPVILWIVGAVRPRSIGTHRRQPWPSLTITVPVHNAATSIRATLERLLQLDYPMDRVQLLVISDASTDGTDAIVREFAGRGVELLRMPTRRGKTAAENAALAAAAGEIIVNVDATVLVPATSLKPLIRAFDDPTVALASGRDCSTGDVSREGTGAESSYVGYEMWVRDLESRIGGIVGASGCFYAIRRSIHAMPLPPDLSWDFASALVAREQGFRAVSVSAATCIVPRTVELRTELRRKVRTMARGLKTLFYKRALLNPLAHGAFAWMLLSHKLLRWLPYLLAPVALAALLFLAVHDQLARVVLGAVLLGIAGGTVAIRTPHNRSIIRPIAFAGFVVAACAAGLLAWRDAIRRTELATWEPTPRPETRS